MTSSESLRLLLLLAFGYLLCGAGSLSWLATLPSWASPPSSSARRSSSDDPTNRIPDHLRILILPGFGNDSLDYFLAQAPHGSLVTSLQKRGWKPDRIAVLPVRRADWVQVFGKGALDGDFWKGTADPTRPAYRWYLDRVASAVHDLTSTDDDGGIDADGDGNRGEELPKTSSSSPLQVILVGHSAGGWLGRAACGFGSAKAAAANPTASDRTDAVPPSPTTPASYALDLSKVAGMVTLGAPHTAPPPPFMDMTRGALRITNERFPGAYHDALWYLTVAGAAVQGSAPERRKSSSSSSPLLFERRSTPATYAYNSYEAVCGVGTAMGDGVVPVGSAHLEGATQLTLPGVFHSINAPDAWYGSDAVLDAWHDALLDIAQRSRREAARRLPAFSLESLFAGRK